MLAVEVAFVGSEQETLTDLFRTVLHTAVAVEEAVEPVVEQSFQIVVVVAAAAADGEV